MSKTDKTRPAWVKKFDTDLPVYVDHDHRHGRCVEETFESAKWYEHSAPRRYSHRCAKWIKVTEPCGGAFGRCWSCANSSNYLARLDWFERWGYPMSTRKCSGPITRSVRDETVHCVSCDDAPLYEESTCDRRFGMRYTRMVSKVYGEHPTRDYTRTWYKKQRQHERLELRDAARDWNMNGDTEIQPEPRQHRHEAHWRYW